MIRSFLVCGATAFAVTACLHTGEDGAAKPRSAKAEVEILNPGPGSGYGRLMSAAGYGTAQVGRDAASDQYVVDQCGLAPAADMKGAFVFPAAAALTMVAGWVIDYAIAQASAAAQRRIAEYSGLSAGALRFGPTLGAAPAKYFYSSVAPPTMDWKCVRLARLVGDGDGKPKVLAAEVILKIEVAPTRDSLLIQPLRLYFETPLAEPGSNFGVAVGASFDGLWQTAATGEGKSMRVWDATILKQKVGNLSKPDRQRFFYYRNNPTLSDNPPQQVPLVPWSYNATGAARPAGAGVLTVTLAEAGDPPFLLTFFAGLAKDHGGEIGGLLKDAAKSAIGD